MKLELHLHTALGSPCGKVDPKEIPALYRAHGYGGIVVTEHFNKKYVDWYTYEAGETLNERFLRSYKILCEAGAECNVRVLLGAEILVDNGVGNMEYLVYGIGEDFFVKYPEAYALTQKELFEICEAEGYYMSQAHPYRKCAQGDVRYMHAAEVYNGHPIHDCHNDEALRFAEAGGLNQTSGSDFHFLGGEARGGIIVPDDLKTGRELVDYLKNNRPKLLRADSVNEE